MTCTIFKRLTRKSKCNRIHFKTLYTEQQKKRIFCIFGIVYKLGFEYRSNDM